MKLDFMLAATDADLDALMYVSADINARMELGMNDDHPYEAGWTALHIAIVYLFHPPDTDSDIDSTQGVYSFGETVSGYSSHEVQIPMPSRIEGRLLQILH